MLRLYVLTDLQLRTYKKVEYIVATVRGAINCQYIVNSCRDLSSFDYSWVPVIAKYWQYIDYWSRRRRPKCSETSTICGNCSNVVKKACATLLEHLTSVFTRFAFRFWRTKRPQKEIMTVTINIFNNCRSWAQGQHVNILSIVRGKRVNIQHP